jgi:hypothetical protein
MVGQMSYSPKKSKENQPKAGNLEKDLFRANQFSERVRRDSATRSTLSRLRNRKSDLK